MSSRSAARRSDSLQGGSGSSSSEFSLRVVFHEVKNRALTGSLVFGDFGGSVEGHIDAFKEAGSMDVGEVKCAGAYET